MSVNFNNYNSYNPKDHYFSVEETGENLHIKIEQKPKEKSPGQARIALIKIKEHAEKKTLELAAPINIHNVAQKIFEGYEAKRGVLGCAWDHFLEYIGVGTVRGELEELVSNIKKLAGEQSIYTNRAEREQDVKNIVELKEIAFLVIETIKDIQSNYHHSYHYETTLNSLSTIDPNLSDEQIEESIIDILSKSNLTHIQELSRRINNEKLKNICVLAEIYMDIETATNFFSDDISSKELLLGKSIKKLIEINKAGKAREVVDLLPFGKEHWTNVIEDSLRN